MYLIAILVCALSLIMVNTLYATYAQEIDLDTKNINNDNEPVNISIGEYGFDPKEVKIKKGQTVIWTNDETRIHTIESGKKDDKDAGTLFSSDYLDDGDTFSYTFNEPGIYYYFDSEFDQYWGAGKIAVSRESISEPLSKPIKQSNNGTNEKTQTTWKNFTNDQSLFAIEYPSQWEVKAGNRFTDDPPLIAYNNNNDSTKVKSQILVNVFDSEGLTAKKWAELKKAELVDKDKTTKLVEPINCNKYAIDNVPACSFVYAGNDETNKRAGILEIFVVDSSNMTHTIEYTADPTKFDFEEPIINHIVNSYKLINNYNQDSALPFSGENTTDTFDNSLMESSSLPPSTTMLEENTTTLNSTFDEFEDIFEDTNIESAENSAVLP